MEREYWNKHRQKKESQERCGMLHMRWCISDKPEFHAANNAMFNNAVYKSFLELLRIGQMSQEISYFFTCHNITLVDQNSETSWSLQTGGSLIGCIETSDLVCQKWRSKP